MTVRTDQPVVCVASTAIDAGVAPLVGEDCQTLAEVLSAVADRYPDNEAYVEGSQRLSFGQWIARADALVGHIRRLGIQPGDVVAVLLPPSIDYAICYAAVTRAGAIMTGINLRLGPEEIGAILQRAQPKLLIVAEDARLPASAGVIPILRRDALATIVTSGESAEPHVGAADDPAIIVWTSGTTGLPKGAWFDHHALKAAVPLAGVMTHPFDRRLVATPFAHAGYMSKLWEQCAFAVTNVLAPQPWKAQDALRLIETEALTVAAAVPTQWEKILECPELSDTRLDTLRLCVTATAPASPILIERVRAAVGLQIIIRYAMTESPTISGTSPDDSIDILCNSVGRAHPSVGIMIVDDEGHPLQQGEVGKIRLKTPAMMRGYWRDDAATAATIDAEGWLLSSDLGLIDPQGNLRMRGRSTEMFIRGGYNVYPAEIEVVLDRHPLVAESAIIGVAAPVIGEIGIGFVAAKGEASPALAAELQDWCGARLADYKVPAHIIFIDALPRTAMQKIDRHALKAKTMGLATESLRGWKPR